MSFGFSVGDFVMLVQMAHRSFRNCKKAGEEYTEITCEVRCLHSVLRTLRSEAQRPDSKIFRQNHSTTAELLSIKDGCKNVLDNLDSVLIKYGGLKADGQAGAGKRLWQRIKFGSKVEELGDIRSKLITYTSTISILIDTMQIQAIDRVESKMDGGFAEVASQFDSMRKSIFDIASFARAEQRKGANMSSLSLSTYAGDEKAVWQDFRRELIKKGFRSQSLEKYKYVLQAYMLKLDQSGLLDQPVNSNSNLNDGALWWMKRMYTETINSLTDLKPTEDPLSSIKQGEPLPVRKVPSNLPFGNINGAVREKETVSHKIPIPSKIVERPNTEQDSDLDLPSSAPDFNADTSSISLLDGNTGPGPPVEGPAKLKLSEVDKERPLEPKLNVKMGSGVEKNGKIKRNRITLAEQWSQREKVVQLKGNLGVAAAVESDNGETFHSKSEHTPLVHFQDPNALRDVFPQQLQALQEDGSPNTIGIKDKISTASVDTKHTINLPREVSQKPIEIALEEPMKSDNSRSPNSNLKASAAKNFYRCVKTLQWLVDARIAIRSSSSLSETAESGVRERESRPYAVTRRRIVNLLTQTPTITGYPERLAKKQIRGILKRPTEQFPEDHNPVREGVASLKDAGKNGIPPDARWTKISRRLVNPEALELRGERFEARAEYVIVLRVLSRDEVQEYADVTARLRTHREENLAEAVPSSNSNHDMPNGASFVNRFNFYQNYVEHYSSGHLKTGNQA